VGDSAVDDVRIGDLGVGNVDGGGDVGVDVVGVGDSCVISFVGVVARAAADGDGDGDDDDMPDLFEFDRGAVGGFAFVGGVLAFSGEVGVEEGGGEVGVVEGGEVRVEEGTAS
jgi:hypothetical protein